MSTISKEKDTASVEGCPYCARCTVGGGCPWCGEQSLCDLCGVCFTEDCGYTRPEEEPEDVAALLREAGEARRAEGRESAGNCLCILPLSHEGRCRCTHGFEWGELARRLTVPVEKLREEA